MSMYTSRRVEASTLVVYPRMVGLVDEQAGGIVGYFEDDKGEEIAKRLNFIQDDDYVDPDMNRWYTMSLSEDNQKDLLKSAIDGELREIVAPLDRHVGYVMNDHADYCVRAVLSAGLLK